MRIPSLQDAVQRLDASSRRCPFWPLLPLAASKQHQRASRLTCAGRGRLIRKATFPRFLQFPTRTHNTLSSNEALLTRLHHLFANLEQCAWTTTDIEDLRRLRMYHDTDEALATSKIFWCSVFINQLHLLLAGQGYWLTCART